MYRTDQRSDYNRSWKSIIFFIKSHYNKSFIGQACSVRTGEYLVSFFFHFCMDLGLRRLGPYKNENKNINLQVKLPQLIKYQILCIYYLSGKKNIWIIFITNVSLIKYTIGSTEHALSISMILLFPKDRWLSLYRGTWEEILRTVEKFRKWSWKYFPLS